MIAPELPKPLRLLILEIPQVESFGSVENTYSGRRVDLAGSPGGYCYWCCSKSSESEPSGLDKSFADSAHCGDIGFAGKVAGNVDIALIATVAGMVIL